VTWSRTSPLFFCAAARYWGHPCPQFENVSSRILVRCLFNADTGKPHFQNMALDSSPRRWFSESRLVVSCAPRNFLNLERFPFILRRDARTPQCPLESHCHYYLNMMGTDVDVQDVIDQTTLHLAALGAKLEAGQLSTRLWPGADSNARAHRKMTPLALHNAARKGHARLARMLLEGGR